MQWYPKQIIVTVAVLVALWSTTTLAQEPKVLGRKVGVSRSERTTARLLWKNGDVLPGKLLESKHGQVRWSSPLFLDELVVDTEVLDSIIFPKQSVSLTEAFRIGTVSGDVFTADLIGSDDNTFLSSSKRYGRARVNRDAIYSLNRRMHPNLVFDGSQLKAWNLSRDATIKDTDWLSESGGHPQTHHKKASISREIEIPKQFEIDLEMASTNSPRFVLALGKDDVSAASNQSLRLETWDNELVVVQDKVFEPVMTIEEDQRNLHLRLSFDGNADELQVYNANGRSLVTVKGVQPKTGLSGIFIRNRGEDLTVRRLSVYRQSSKGAKQAIDPAKPRVYLIDGRVVYGHLYVENGNAYVADKDETHNVDLGKVDRIVIPDVKLAATAYLAELIYADGAMIRGRIEQANSDQVILRTAFSDTPVTCTLAGAALLRFDPSASEAKPPSTDSDQLFSALGRFRGRLSFDMAESPLSWRPEGVVEPLRLANTGRARVERSDKSVTKGSSFDEKEFSSLLHLKNGEIIPCQVLSYSENTLSFQSPFINKRKIGTTHVKAIEFTPSISRNSEEELPSDIDNWLKEILGPEQNISTGIDPVKLDRALTVPRFSRDNPPSHILVAKNGDLKRGKLLGISGKTIEFESKLRKLTVPINRVARVVNVSKPEEEPDEPATIAADSVGTVRATLADGSILVFEALESSDGKLRGRSSIYGEMVIPTESIQELNFGEFEKEKFRSVFEEWVVRQAKEPEFGK